METFEPACRWRASPGRRGLRLRCARFAGLVRPGDKEPQTPGPGEARRALRAPGLWVPARSAQARCRAWPPGTVGSETSASARVLEKVGVPTARVPSEGRTAPSGCFVAPVAFGDWFVNLNAPTDWFSPSNRRDAYKPRAIDFVANVGRGWWWWCKSIISRILPAYSVITSEGIRCILGNQGSVSAPRPEIFSPKSRSSVSILQVRCAPLSAWDAYVITHIFEIYTCICMHIVYICMCVCIYIFTAIDNPSFRNAI